MSEQYRGWYLSAYCVGTKGEYAGDARDSNEYRSDIIIGRFGGKGAKKKVIECLKRKVDQAEKKQA